MATVVAVVVVVDDDDCCYYRCGQFIHIFVLDIIDYHGMNRVTHQWKGKFVAYSGKNLDKQFINLFPFWLRLLC